MAIENETSDYETALALNSDPFSPDARLRFFYDYESFEQSLALFKRLIEGTEIIILVLGEEGAGKTTLLQRYLASSKLRWKASRIRIPSVAEKLPTELFNEMNSYPAYVTSDSTNFIIIIDDAHKLYEQQLKFLLKNSFSVRSSQGIKRFILLGEPGLIETISEIANQFADEIALSKVFLPKLSKEETAAYLNYRMAVAGYVGKSVFNSSAVKKIYHSSGGLPGRINRLAHQWLQNKYAHKTQHRNVSNILRDQGRRISWSVISCTAGVLALVTLYHFMPISEPTPTPQLHQVHVIRKKITAADQFAPALADISETKELTAVAPPSLATGLIDSETSPSDAALEKKASDTLAKPSSTVTPWEKPAIASVQEPSYENQKKQAEQERIIHREKWLLEQNSSFYTIQLMGVGNEQHLLTFLENNKWVSDSGFAYYRTRYKGKDWYPLLYGVYATKQEAYSAMKELPTALQKATPWIRQMSAIHKEIQTHANN